MSELISPIPRIFKRRYYVQFNCFNCQKNTKPNEWSSNYGSAQIQYKLILKYFMKQKDNHIPFKLQCSFKIYSQKCNQCNKYAEGFMLQNPIKHLALKFCRKLLTLMTESKINSYEQKFIEPDLEHHEHDMCQACEQNCCPSDGYDDKSQYGQATFCYFYYPRNGIKYIPNHQKRREGSAQNNFPKRNNQRTQNKRKSNFKKNQEIQIQKQKQQEPNEQQYEFDELDNNWD